MGGDNHGKFLPGRVDRAVKKKKKKMLTEGREQMRMRSIIVTGFRKLIEENGNEHGSYRDARRVRSAKWHTPMRHTTTTVISGFFVLKFSVR